MDVLVTILVLVVFWYILSTIAGGLLMLGARMYLGKEEFSNRWNRDKYK